MAPKETALMQKSQEITLKDRHFDLSIHDDDEDELEFQSLAKYLKRKSPGQDPNMESCKRRKQSNAEYLHQRTFFDASSFPESSKQIMIDLIPRLPNIANNCWLNSVTQAIISTLGIQNSVYSCTLGEGSLAKLWWDFVKDIINNKNKGYETSGTMMVTLLRNITRCRSDLVFNSQHDALFLTKLSEETDERELSTVFEIKWSVMSTCYRCGFSENLDEEEHHTLFLDLEDNESPSTQSLIDDYFADNQLGFDFSDGIDCKCGKVEVKGYGKSILGYPPVLMIVIKRYSYDREVEMSTKNRKCVLTDYFVTLEMHGAANPIKGNLESETCHSQCGSKYMLRSVLLHHGNSPDVGHYTTLVYLTENLVIFCDDLNIKFATSETVNMANTDGYIFVYENLQYLYHKMESSVPATIAAICTRYELTKLWPERERDCPQRPKSLHQSSI